MRAAVAALIALVLAGAARAQEADYGQAFVSAFAEACVPQRLSYAGTRAQAESLGWVAAARTAHPELATLMSTMDTGFAEAEEEMNATLDVAIYARQVAGAPHILIVAHSSFLIEVTSEPERWSYIGCYLYNFDATAPIDPTPVTALIEKPISQEVDQDGLVSYVWGPACPMPRTGDTHLTFIAEGSPFAEQTGFTGLMMKFETSEPDEGVEVPETYCTEDDADDLPSAEN